MTMGKIKGKGNEEIRGLIGSEFNVPQALRLSSFHRCLILLITAAFVMGVSSVLLLPATIQSALIVNVLSQIWLSFSSMQQFGASTASQIVIMARIK